MNERRPAWASESVLLRFDERPTIDELTPAWAFDGATGAGVRVAVIDSGIEADHPALEGCVDVDDGIVFTVAGDGTVVSERGPHPDVFGHGTACAGIIHHLAPDARITSVRVLGPNLGGKAAAFHAGLTWAVEQGFDVINLSLGTTKRDWALAFHDICDQAYFTNSFLVTAANNVMRTSFPSLFASVASVACNTTTDPRRFHANPDPPTEFLARGIDVEVAWLGGGTSRSTGNSYAAPHIAGLAAQIRSKHPELRPFQVKTVLWATAANVRDPGIDSEAAGRRSTSYGTLHRSTSMRGTSMRGTSMRATSMPAAPTPATAATGTSTPAASTRATVRPTRPSVEPTAAGGRGEPTLAEVVASLGNPHLAGGPHIGASRVVESQGHPGAWWAAAALAVVDAMGTLALAGLVHGALRLDDVVIGPDGRVLVTGFDRLPSPGGAARAGAVLSVAAMRWLAPEQLRDGPATPAADVHAAAMVAVELLTGDPAWPRAERVGDLLRQRLGDRPRPVASLGSGDRRVPARAASVLDRALDPDPFLRQAGCDDLARELAADLAGALGADALRDAGPLHPARLDALLAAGRPR